MTQNGVEDAVQFAADGVQLRRSVWGEDLAGQAAGDHDLAVQFIHMDAQRDIVRNNFV